MARIGLLMSGGIDSSAAAILLREDGHEVIGITARMWSEASKCCSEEDIYRAQRICHKLGIQHIVVDIRETFRRQVFDVFVESYLKGLTPNPCALCNRDVKFDLLLKKALTLGCERVATGHYARLCERDGIVLICEPQERKKSQIYFLSLVRKEVLAKLVFPLSSVTKDDARRLVREHRFPAREGESQDLCFVTRGHYEDLIKPYAKGVGSGEVVTLEGEVVSTHRGHFSYTIGQKFGVRGRRYYVIKKDAEANRIVIGRRQDALKTRIAASRLNLFIPPDCLPREEIGIKYRYSQELVKARIVEVSCDDVIVTTEKPCFAPAPGQILALYEGDILLGGGIIE